MISISENGQKIINPTKNQVFAELSKLDGVVNSYMSLEDDRSSYIQVGGGPIEFTVEVRKMTSGEEFTHWKAEVLNMKNNGDSSIIISGSVVQVKLNQILNKNIVMLLFEAFMDGNLLPNMVGWHDMTEMFLL